jgi:hypothetical protein
MDSSRFDTLTKVLARSSSRRQMLQGLAATALGGVLASLGIKQVGASPLSDPKEPCENVTCQPGQICKGGKCVTDPCADVTCQPGQICKNGKCKK